MVTKLPITWILVFGLLSTSYGLLIGSFNIEKFGEKKSSNQTLMRHIVRIINRYDVILIQEVVDRSSTTINRLMSALNQPGSVGFIPRISDRLGTSSYKEQYLFLIRKDSGLRVKAVHQYTGMGFARPPFSIRLDSRKTGIKDFALMAIHTTPDPAITINETGELATAHEVLQTEWNTSNILIMGDLNAGGAYVRIESLDNLAIRKPPFNWLIGDFVDTTTKSAEKCAFDPNYSTHVDDGYNARPQTTARPLPWNLRTRSTTPRRPRNSKAKKRTRSRCAYDRFIMTGDEFNGNLIANSARVFPFDREHGLTPEWARAVSNHYPIELELRNIYGSPSRTGSRKRSWSSSDSLPRIPKIPRRGFESLGSGNSRGV